MSSNNDPNEWNDQSDYNESLLIGNFDGWLSNDDLAEAIVPSGNNRRIPPHGGSSMAVGSSSSGHGVGMKNKTTTNHPFQDNNATFTTMDDGYPNASSHVTQQQPQPTNESMMSVVDDKAKQHQHGPSGQHNNKNNNHHDKGRMNKNTTHVQDTTSSRNHYDHHHQDGVVADDNNHHGSRGGRDMNQPSSMSSSSSSSSTTAMVVNSQQSSSQPSLPPPSSIKMEGNRSNHHGTTSGGKGGGNKHDGGGMGHQSGVSSGQIPIRIPDQQHQSHLPPPPQSSSQSQPLPPPPSSSTHQTSRGFDAHMNTQYSHHLHFMHLQHLSQINHSSKASDYYNRPLEGPRSVLPIDRMNEEGVEKGSSSSAVGGDGGDSGGDSDEDESEDDGDETGQGSGKRRKSGPGKSPKHAEANAKAKNREHAKNTRIRKKNYIEALKESVKLLAEERETVDRERKLVLSRLAEQTSIRKQVLQTVLFYRSSAEMDPSRWRAVLEETFQLILPITPYRSFPPAEVIGGQRRVVGIDALINDTASLAVMVQSIGVPKNDGDSVHVQYYCGPEDTIMTGDSFMCKWLLRTENAVDRGARYDVFKQGMIKATFSPQNRLTSLELFFDVMSFMQQLRRASGKHDFQVVPNTVPIAKEDVSEPRVITEAEAPYRIIFVSPAFKTVFGYTAEEMIGNSCKMLQGPETEQNRIAELMTHIKMKRAGSTVVTNYTSKGDKIVIFVRVYPLYTDGVLTHYLGSMEPIPSENGGVAMNVPPPVSVAVTNTTHSFLANNNNNNNNNQPNHPGGMINNNTNNHDHLTVTSTSSMVLQPEGNHHPDHPVGGVHRPNHEDDQGSNNNDNNCVRDQSPDRETSETGNEGGSERDGVGSEGGDGGSSPSAELQEYPPLTSPYANSHASKQGGSVTVTNAVPPHAIHASLVNNNNSNSSKTNNNNKTHNHQSNLSVDNDTTTMNICIKTSSSSSFSSSHIMHVTSHPHPHPHPPSHLEPPPSHNTIYTTSSLPTNLSVQLPDKMTDPSMASSVHDEDRDPQPLSGIPSNSTTSYESDDASDCQHQPFTRIPEWLRNSSSTGTGGSGSSSSNVNATTSLPLTGDHLGNNRPDGKRCVRTGSPSSRTNTTTAGSSSDENGDSEEGRRSSSRRCRHRTSASSSSSSHSASSSSSSSSSYQQQEGGSTHKNNNNNSTTTTTTKNKMSRAGGESTDDEPGKRDNSDTSRMGGKVHQATNSAKRPYSE